MRFFRARTNDTPAPLVTGYSPEHHALERPGFLSTRPGPDEATAANGRFFVIADRVMFSVGELNHSTILARCGLPAPPDLAVGYYTASRADTDAPWRFVIINHRLLRGSRVGPDEGSGAVANAAFAASGYGDVSKVLRR